MARTKPPKTGLTLQKRRSSDASNSHKSATTGSESRITPPSIPQLSPYRNSTEKNAGEVQEQVRAESQNETRPPVQGLSPTRKPPPSRVHKQSFNRIPRLGQRLRSLHRARRSPSPAPIGRVQRPRYLDDSPSPSDSDGSEESVNDTTDKEEDENPEETEEPDVPMEEIPQAQDPSYPPKRMKLHDGGINNNLTYDMF